jgi:C_GCAxxG_C_C family probable redox protein
MSMVEEAVDRFNSGYNCSQSILFTYGSEIGLREETALLIAGPFGGGISRRKQACGAVTGAVMVLGLRYGSKDPKDKEAKERLLRITQGFIDRFKEENENVGCHDLLGLDLGTASGHAEAKSRDLFHTRCPEFVRSAAMILEEIISVEG